MQSSELGETMVNLKEGKEQQDRSFLTGHQFEGGFGNNSEQLLLKYTTEHRREWMSWSLLFPDSKKGLKGAGGNGISLGLKDSILNRVNTCRFFKMQTKKTTQTKLHNPP